VSVVADTHALHWFVTGAEQLSARAREALEAAEADLAGGIYVSVASRLDLHYLVAAGRMDRTLASRMWSVVHDPDLNIHPLPITAEIVERFGDAALASLRDPWDRLIVATTLVLGIPLVSADRVIARVAGVDVVW
jgi:PIN domain nuclease of toxin-antitoxin system